MNSLAWKVNKWVGGIEEKVEVNQFSLVLYSKKARYQTIHYSIVGHSKEFNSNNPVLQLEHQWYF